jgi:hypothetical protein
MAVINADENSSAVLKKKLSWLFAGCQCQSH